MNDIPTPGIEDASEEQKLAEAQNRLEQLRTIKEGLDGMISKQQEEFNRLLSHIWKGIRESTVPSIVILGLLDLIRTDMITSIQEVGKKMDAVTESADSSGPRN